jgi:hypothetical protein
MPANKASTIFIILFTCQLMPAYYWGARKSPASALTENGAKSSKRSKPHAELSKSIIGSLRRKGKLKCD